MSEPEVTILLPNYKTPELTKLCFRLLNKFTPPGRMRIIAVDNASGDASLEYLRSLKWITLLERKDVSGETAPQMHARALDMGLRLVDTEFVMVMHTDTLVADPQWLDFLLSRIRESPDIAGVGSWKLEHVSALKHFGKRIEDFFRHLTGKNAGPEDRYLRSHCALYRTDPVRRLTHGFDDGETAGRSLHRMLIREGFRMEFLPSEELGKYVRHLNHATSILNPGEHSRRSSRPEAGRRLRNAMEMFRETLEDSSLDERKEL